MNESAAMSLAMLNGQSVVDYVPISKKKKPETKNPKMNESAAMSLAMLNGNDF